MSNSKLIDHTLLSATAQRRQVETLIEQAAQSHFASVCVNPCWVALAAERLADSDVQVCTVIGFPLGATTTAVKAFEAHDAVMNGATEVDMVINIGAAKDGDWQFVEEDIRAVVAAVDSKALVKVIVETCYLTDEEISQACISAQHAGADFVKTSTGFGTAGGRTCGPHAPRSGARYGGQSFRRGAHPSRLRRHGRGRGNQNWCFQRYSAVRRGRIMVSGRHSTSCETTIRWLSGSDSVVPVHFDFDMLPNVGRSSQP